MARIAYPNIESHELQPLVEKIKRERGKLPNLYRMLLNSPPVAEGWLAFLTSVRQQSHLSGRLREMVITRVAVLNGADYEFAAHAPLALKEGITEQQIQGLRSGDFSAFDGFDRGVLAYCDSMTQAVQVPQSIFDIIKTGLNEREVVELTATIAAYNLVSRFLEALQIDHE